MTDILQNDIHRLKNIKNINGKGNNKTECETTIMSIKSLKSLDNQNLVESIINRERISILSKGYSGKNIKKSKFLNNSNLPSG